MGNYALAWVLSFCSANDWASWFNWMESDCYILKLYRFNVILNMAMNIHLTVRFLQLRKEFNDLGKNEAILENM